jgi:hypothetical protein
LRSSGRLVGTLAYAQGCFVIPTAAEKEARKLAADAKKTLVVTDKAILNTRTFSLGATLGAIITSAGGNAKDSNAERIALLASMIRSFNAVSHVNPESGLDIPVSPRPNEAKLDPVKLLHPRNFEPDFKPEEILKPGDLEFMHPIGVFNRIDTAPADWNDCGEHRIVYGKGLPAEPPVAGDPFRTNRFLLIFEARIDNPDPNNSKEGCRPIVEFWRSLQSLQGTALASALARFYYEGLDTDGDGAADIKPVIHYQNFGVPFGQVRGNIFVQGSATNPWMLREWRISVTPDGAPTFVVDTVKKNPNPTLYAATQPSDGPGMDALRIEFQDSFLGRHMREMLDVDLAARSKGNPVEISDVVQYLGASFADRHNSFESIAQGTDHDPLEKARGTPLISRAAARMKTAELDLANACSVTAEHMINRAGAISCGGCHDFSANREIAPGFTWPKPAGRFVHNSETGELSELLEVYLLPERRQFMDANFPAVGAAVTGQPMLSTRVASRAAAPIRAQARSSFLRAKNSDTRSDRIQALAELEARVSAARSEDQQIPGVFGQFRRAH